MQKQINSVQRHRSCSLSLATISFRLWPRQCTMSILVHTSMGPGAGCLDFIMDSPDFMIFWYCGSCSRISYESSCGQ